MAKQMNKHSITIKIHDVRLEKGWSDSKLLIEQYGEGIGYWKRATILIESPSDLSYIRERLDEIEAYWKSRLGIKS